MEHREFTILPLFPPSSLSFYSSRFLPPATSSDFPRLRTYPPSLNVLLQAPDTDDSEVTDNAQYEPFPGSNFPAVSASRKKLSGSSGVGFKLVEEVECIRG
jgi:hypothetical protein